MDRLGLIPAVEDTRKFSVFPKKISPIIPLGGLWDESTSSEEKKFAPPGIPLIAPGPQRGS